MDNDPKTLKYSAANKLPDLSSSARHFSAESTSPISSPARHFSVDSTSSPSSHAADFSSQLGSLFSSGYNDRPLNARGQLQHWVSYLHDNPRRLALKRANPDLFRIHRQTEVNGVPCTTLGNMFLAKRPMRAVLQCSRRMTQAEIDTKRELCLRDAGQGTVFISAAISKGEKQISRALREAGYPLIILLEQGFPEPDSPNYRYFKPTGIYFEACAAGNLLLIDPAKELFESSDIVSKVTSKAGNLPHDSLRYRFLALNYIAEAMSTS